MLGEARVDLGFSHQKGFSGPLLEVAGIEQRLVNRVCLGNNLGATGERGPFGVAHGKDWVANGRVQHRVPEAVETAYTVDRWGNPFRVATSVTGRVFTVQLSGSVERLMDVAHVVDD